MAVGDDPLPTLAPIAGVRLAAVAAGIRKPDRLDLVLFELTETASCAALFTTNRFRAAPVRVAEDHLRAVDAIRYLLVNTGYANAGTGEAGRRDARMCCMQVAAYGACAPEAVLPFSTGVIGEPLPVDRIRRALPGLFDALSENGWTTAAQGILTTDTRAKGLTETVEIDGRRATLTGIAKGAGMIRPDMATMLAFVATDAAMESGLARQALRTAVEGSFNRITVDGDTSTNDACVLIASGAGEVSLDCYGPNYERFLEALTRLCRRLAQAIVRDAEGATRMVTVAVTGAATEAEADRVAFTVAQSPLVKTAVFAGDPNWGRILAAVGRAGVTDLDVERVRLWLDDYCIAEADARAAGYDEASASAKMAGDEVIIRVDLGRGEAETEVWTCDLSHDYVSINADYRS